MTQQEYWIDVTAVVKNILDTVDPERTVPRDKIAGIRMFPLGLEIDTYVLTESMRAIQLGDDGEPVMKTHKFATLCGQID